MTHEPLEPLDRELADLLRAEKGAVFAPKDAKARVRARLDRGIDGAGGGGGLVPSTPRSPMKVLRRAPSLALAFVIGGVTGAWLLRASEPATAPRVVYIDRAASAEPVASEAPHVDVLAPPAIDAAALPIAARAIEAAAPARRSPDRLAEERAVLEIARVALARRSGDDALAAVTTHERRFPSGALAEEREAIAVQALVLAKRADEARARGEAFRAKYPESMLASSVDAALRTIR